MATRDGVEEYSISPIAQRSSERSIRASWTTGYWGASDSMFASISTRFATTAPTTVRASSPAAASASTSARSRSRTAVAVRSPKSASNTAESATRRPARSDRMRSGLSADAIDQHGDRADSLAEEPLDREPDRVPDVPAHPDEIGARPGDDAQLELDAVLPDADDDRRSREGGAPRRSPAGDAQHVGGLEGRKPGNLDDDAPSHGELDRLRRRPDRLRVDDERVT